MLWLSGTAYGSNLSIHVHAKKWEPSAKPKTQGLEFLLCKKFSDL
jgi:hypothetical protein